MRPIWMPVSVSYSFLVTGPIFVHAAWEADLFAVVNDLSNRRDNSSSTAKTALCEVFYFIEVYFSFLCLKSKVILGNIDQGTACDGWKDTVRLRCYNLAVLCYEQEVCSACLLNLGTCLGASRYMFSSKPCSYEHLRWHEGSLHSSGLL